MTQAITYTILSVIAVSLISLIGLITLPVSTWGKRALKYLVSFSAGALIGDVFIHMLPELVEDGLFDFSTSMYILAAIVGFFILERFIHWHHHHGDHGDETEHSTHPFVFLNLIGDGVHNLIDGMIIAGAYMIDIQLGIATTMAVILHEIPQEIGDFGILLYGGWTKAKALAYNLLSGLTALAGALIVLWIGETQNLAHILIALGSGTFIYISLADLVPELHKSRDRAVSQFFTFILGIAVMFLLLLLE